MKKKYIISAAILGLLIIIVGSFFAYNFLFVKKEEVKVNQTKVLTDEQKQNILNELMLNSSSTKTLSTKEKTMILKNISTTTKSLSDDEKAKILESLVK